MRASFACARDRGRHVFLRARARGSVPPSDVSIIFQDTILRRRRCDAEVAPKAVKRPSRLSGSAQGAPSRLSRSAQGVRGARLAGSVVLVQQAWLGYAKIVSFE
jgi:hypothetical protein